MKDKLLTFLKTKKMATIKVDGVSIVLTKEQLEDIDRQRSTPKSGKDITSYEIACKVFGMIGDPCASATQKLKMMIKAANFLDNGGREWEFNYDRDAYLPWFKRSGSGLVFYVSGRYCDCGYCFGQVAMYFKNKATSDFFGVTHIGLYNQWAKE